MAAAPAAWRTAGGLGVRRPRQQAGLKQELIGRHAPPVERLGSGCDGPVALEQLLRACGAEVIDLVVERRDVVYADGQAWWDEQWTHGERLALERMDEHARSAYRAAALDAIESCREADGALHWRPEVAYGVATVSPRRGRSCCTQPFVS
jgi:hypothetical protein